MAAVTTKVCNGCFQVKPLEAYAKQPAGVLGCRATCKVCINTAAAAGRQLLADQRLVASLAPTTKTCTKCHVAKDLGSFWKSAGGLLGVRGTCIECEQEKRIITASIRTVPAITLPLPMV